MLSPPPRPSAIADELAEAIGADRALMVQQLPSPIQPAAEALWCLDAAMGDVVARLTDPMLARIKLAWWRDELEALDRSAAPAEPRLQAVSKHLISRGISGAELSKLEAGWAALLDDPVDRDLVAARGSQLFALIGRLLSANDPKLGDAGALFALASVGRRGVPSLLEAARPLRSALQGHVFPVGLRVLTMLARAAGRDLGDTVEPEGSRRRLLAMLAHRWSGRI